MAHGPTTLQILAGETTQCNGEWVQRDGRLHCTKCEAWKPVDSSLAGLFRELGKRPTDS